MIIGGLGVSGAPGGQLDELRNDGSRQDQGSHEVAPVRLIGRIRKAMNPPVDLLTAARCVKRLNLDSSLGAGTIAAALPCNSEIFLFVSSMSKNIAES